VDGFDKDQATGETDESRVAGVGFVAAHCDAFEAFQLADGLLDAGSELVEELWEEPASLL
jgi:hypothetical protein